MATETPRAREPTRRRSLRILRCVPHPNAVPDPSRRVRRSVALAESLRDDGRTKTLVPRARQREAPRSALGPEPFRAVRKLRGRMRLTKPPGRRLGGFVVFGRISEGFARSAYGGGALAGARRERLRARGGARGTAFRLSALARGEREAERRLTAAPMVNSVRFASSSERTPHSPRAVDRPVRGTVWRAVTSPIVARRELFERGAGARVGGAVDCRVRGSRDGERVGRSLRALGTVPLPYYRPSAMDKRLLKKKRGGREELGLELLGNLGAGQGTKPLHLP